MYHGQINGPADHLPSVIHLHFSYSTMMFSWGQTAMNTRHTPSFVSMPSLITLNTKKDVILTFIPQRQHTTAKECFPSWHPAYSLEMQKGH